MSELVLLGQKKGRIERAGLASQASNSSVIQFYPTAGRYAEKQGGSPDNPVALTPQVQAMLDLNCVVAVGVSGGKDSDACAIAVDRHLNAIGHTGPRVLVHADLGTIEWKDSLPGCQRLAEKLGWELMVLPPTSGGMIGRWKRRWENNVARYNSLECVKLILPWSTPTLRFCTSEKKSAPIAAALRRRYPEANILNVTGVRREESASRRKAAISSVDAKLSRKNWMGVTWNAIIEWPVEDVLATIKHTGLRLHEAYVEYYTSRVSCAFCIMSSLEDMIASANCEDNQNVYRVMVELEAESTFGFQGNRWLADVAPHLLSPELLERVAEAKRAAQFRVEAEAQLPEHLLYTKGWPTAIPTQAEAELIASVRQRVSWHLGLNAKYLTADAVIARYAELLAMKALKEAKAKAKATKAKRTKGLSKSAESVA